MDRSLLAASRKTVTLGSKGPKGQSLALRAATSLARLWQHQSKKAEAHHVLFEVYHWFIEGFDTKDLQGTKVLLESLGSCV